MTTHGNMHGDLFSTYPLLPFKSVPVLLIILYQNIYILDKIMDPHFHPPKYFTTAMSMTYTGCGYNPMSKSFLSCNFLLTEFHY